MVLSRERQQKERSDILLPDSKVWDTLRLESNAGAEPGGFRRVRGGAQTNPSNGEDLVEGDKCTHDPSPATNKKSHACARDLVPLMFDSYFS